MQLFDFRPSSLPLGVGGEHSSQVVTVRGGVLTCAATLDHAPQSPLALSLTLHPQ